MTDQEASRESARALLKDLEFPQPPSDENPQDNEAVRLLMAGQSGQRLFYETLARSLSGDKAFLARLLLRDWKRRFGSLMGPAGDLLSSLNGGRKPAPPPEPLPAEASIRKMVDALVKAKKEADETELMSLIHEFSTSALVATQLVPWKADGREVYEYFAECVEAEDQHLELIAMLTELVREDEAPGAA